MRTTQARRILMAARQQLIDRWQAGLDENAEAAKEASRFRWLRQVYVRIYRFLISRYSRADGREDSPDGVSNDDVELATSLMPFVDHTADATGLEPKSTEQIRDKLAAIHAANERRQPSGVMQAVSTKSWVPIAAGKDRKSLERIRRKLASHGFDVRTEHRTTDFCVEVRYGDFDDAIVVLRHGDWRTPGGGNLPARVRARHNLAEAQARFLSGVGIIMFGLAASAFVALLFTDLLDHATIESFALLLVITGLGLVCALAPRTPR